MSLHGLEKAQAQPLKLIYRASGLYPSAALNHCGLSSVDPFVYLGIMVKIERLIRCLADIDLSISIHRPTPEWYR